MSIEVDDYNYLSNLLRSKFDIKYEVENRWIREFFEGPIPLFKLLFVKNTKKDETSIMVSFHLDVDSVDAIQWFLRIRSIFKPLTLTQCYYKDDNKETFLGVEAEQLKLYKIQQAALIDWGSNKKSARALTKTKAVGRSRPIGRDKGFSNLEDAEKEFFIMMPNKQKDTIQ